MGLRIGCIMWNVLILLFISSSSSSWVSATVSYDHKAIIINGQRKILISGSIHYPRSTPQVFGSSPGKAYTKWAASMAVGLGTGVPWVMCKQDDAPDPVINACNGFYCEGFIPNGNNKPKMWTESWTGWYTEFGGAVPYRPAEDLAFSVARFIHNGGSFFNYYMYHGGTNFGRTAGGPFIATSYDYDAPLDEYGLRREPKWGHLRDLHRAIKLCEPALVSVDPTVTKLGNNQEAHVFKTSSSCAAFLSNYDSKYSVKVTFGNSQYDLPPWSISILPDCKTAVYNTARVSSQSSQMKMSPVNSAFSWQSYNEESPSAFADDSVTRDGLLEQINLTRDASDYLILNCIVFALTLLSVFLPFSRIALETSHVK